MLVYHCLPRFSVSYRVVLAMVVSVAGASALSFADGPKLDTATLQATETESLRGVLTQKPMSHIGVICPNTDFGETTFPPAEYRAEL